MFPIKAIILDVDGVIIGQNAGFNFPNPNKDVINRLKAIRKRGIHIILCTGKPNFSIRKIVVDARLSDPHIANCGSVIIDLLKDKVLKHYVINPKDTIRVIKTYLASGIYVDIYSIDNYFTQKNILSDITKIQTKILQKKPIIVNSLADEAKKQEIVKIMPIARNQKDKQKLVKLFNPFKNILSLSGGTSPIAPLIYFGVITSRGTSKYKAIKEIAENINIPLNNMLGIGDGMADWEFIEYCGYGAAMGNATQEIKDLVLSKGKDYSYIGKSVDENGVLDILDHFLT